MNVLKWVPFPDFLCASVAISVAFFFTFFLQWGASLLVRHRKTLSQSLSGNLVLVRVILSEAKNRTLLKLRFFTALHSVQNDNRCAEIRF
ncbi:MAG: hypothetical protein DRP97_00605 [Candidatus Latescibacterota bacterium]|nr:MAG: hypothetical protein B1H02_02660 [Candidatus Latescibacteria bacterium 4484_107]RKY72483.1 MAG: hypothetical protein DRP97_00605 [Candidatus Latescibacterota bacterium]